jgi:hypothetical protein
LEVKAIAKGNALYSADDIVEGILDYQRILKASPVEGTSIPLHRYQSSRYSRLTSIILAILSVGYGLPYR